MNNNLVTYLSLRETRSNLSCGSQDILLKNRVDSKSNNCHILNKYSMV